MELALYSFESGYEDEELFVKINKLESQVLLGFHFVSSRLQEFSIPTPVDRPTKKDHLWRHTCFEVFFGFHDQCNYMEYNFSPNKNWNQYYFLEYRKLQKKTFDIPFVTDVFRSENSYDFAVQFSRSLLDSFSFDKIFPTVILEHKEKGLSHWASRHGEKPDFHNQAFYLDFV